MSDLMEQAMIAKTNGDITLAKQLLSQVLIQDPNNEAAWMMMSDVVEDVRMRRNCLERVLAINPDNNAASVALTKLNTSPLSPVQRGERDKVLNPLKLEKIPPFTPPFTWEGEQEQYLALGDHTYPDLPAEQPEQEPETAPTFDWANDSEEPDKTIEKIFSAISNPELASQPLPDTDLSWLHTSTTGEQTDTSAAAEGDNLDKYLNELVGPLEETQPEQPLTSSEDFSVSAEPELGVGAFTTPEQPIELSTTGNLLWDNPKAKADRLVILSNVSIIYASPKSSDIPHILGLFSESKMLRDLLGNHAGIIRLDSILRLTANPKTSKLTIDYLHKDKPTTHRLTFSSLKIRDEVLAAIKLRLGSSFSRSLLSFGLLDKIVPPFVVLLLVAFLEWALLAGLPMLSGLPASELGQLQGIIYSLQGFVSSIGSFYLMLIIGFFGLLALIWMLSNLTKPSKLIVVERR